MCISMYFISFLVAKKAFEREKLAEITQESKLQSLGVEPEEIGFEAIQTATSLMPARLVTKAWRRDFMALKGS